MLQFLPVNDPTVSVIVPCHNAAPWLGAALDSAFGQEHVEFEVIVVDDGSTDDSPAIAQSFVQHGIKIITQPSRGAAAARNRGLQQARGRYVQFLDADDALGPDKLAAQVDRLERHGDNRALASAAWGRFLDGQPISSAVFSAERVFRDFVPAYEFLVLHAATGEMMHPGAWLCPRAVLAEAGPWNEKLSLNDDGEYFARVVSRASSIFFVSAAHSHYRSGLPHSLSRRRARSALVSLYASTQGITDQLRGCEDSPRTRAALAELWQRTAYELYPDARDLSRAAQRQARHYGNPITPLPCGPRVRWLCRLGAWKMARWLQVRFRTDRPR